MIVLHVGADFGTCWAGISRSGPDFEYDGHRMIRWRDTDEVMEDVFGYRYDRAAKLQQVQFDDARGAREFWKMVCTVQGRGTGRGKSQDHDLQERRAIFERNKAALGEAEKSWCRLQAIQSLVDGCYDHGGPVYGRYPPREEPKQEDRRAKLYERYQPGGEDADYFQTLLHEKRRIEEHVQRLRKSRAAGQNTGADGGVGRDGGAGGRAAGSYGSSLRVCRR